MSADFLRLVGTVAGGRTSGRRSGLSSGHRRGAVSQERHSEAQLGTDTEGRGR